MFCEYCGTELRNEARFCKKCGKPVYTSETVSEAVAPESEKNDAEMQFNETLRLAESGDMNAQFELGSIFACKEEFTDAIQWFEKAAAQGHVLAISSLGTIYLNGHGVDKDIQQALNYLTKAAELGDTQALFNLADYYTNKAIECYAHVLAKCEDAEIVDKACSCLLKDKDKAIEWLTKAREQGDEAADYAIQQIEKFDK